VAIHVENGLTKSVNGRSLKAIVKGYFALLEDEDGQIPVYAIPVYAKWVWIEGFEKA